VPTAKDLGYRHEAPDRSKLPGNRVQTGEGAKLRAGGCAESRNHEARPRNNHGARHADRGLRSHPWIFPRDPNFAVKAARVLDLYERV
jgi:hypothetical protein